MKAKNATEIKSLSENNICTQANVPAVIQNNSQLACTSDIYTLEIISEEDQILASIFENEKDAERAVRLMKDFVYSYEKNKDAMPLNIWLDKEFVKHPKAWKNEEDRKAHVKEIIEITTEFSKNTASLSAHVAKGKSSESWLATKIEEGAAASGVITTGQYAAKLDAVVTEASERMRDCVTTLQGNINANPSLHGFIAEQHHVNTFNIKAETSGSQYRAEVCTPKPGEGYGKNSVDIVIKDSDGKIVKRYQSKYCSTASKTDQAYADGKYRGQGKLVPAEQAGDISKGREVIEIDGVKSEPLTYDEAHEMRQDAQKDSEIKDYTWDDLNRIDIAKQIGKQALIGATIGAAFQGCRIIGRRAWNAIMGNEQQEGSEDLKEFFESSLQTGASVGVSTALTGAMTVFCRTAQNPLIRNTPLGIIGALAYTGIEHAKVFYKFAKGELDGPEAIDALGQSSCCVMGTLGGGFLGAKYGAMAGAVFGLAGSIVGGFVGGVVGSIAGSSIGEAVWQGAKKIGNAVSEGLKSAVSAIGKTVSNIASGISNFCSNLFSW